ncbi:MAG TPA: hypothetical protein VNT54_04605 [Solirubrobacteraceae bacterium]|nr:hypothetical protein [Solirubrobacteraceae bacterium]
MTEDASASVQPDASIEVAAVDAAHAATQRLGYGVPLLTVRMSSE